MHKRIKLIKVIPHAKISKKCTMKFFLETCIYEEINLINSHLPKNWKNWLINVVQLQIK